MIKKSLAALIIMCSLALPAHAQGPDWVQSAKDELAAQGVKTEKNGPCGPFQIANLVAFRHADSGIGLVSKPNGNHCEWPAGSGQFYSVDFLMFRDLSGVDILTDSENLNKPQWITHSPDGNLAGRWRPGIDPGFGTLPSTPIPPVTPPGVPPAPTVDLTGVNNRLAAAESLLAALTAQIAAISASLAVVDGNVQALASKPIPTACTAAASLWGTRIPISCKLN